MRPGRHSVTNCSYIYGKNDSKARLYKYDPALAVNLGR